jgi:DNA polymerase I
VKYEIVGGFGNDPKIAILCPRIQKSEVHKHYFDGRLDVVGHDVMVCDLYLDRTKKKTSVAQIKEYLNDLLPNLIDAGIEMLVVTQPDYFKVLSSQAKTDAAIGDVFDGPAKLKVTYCPNYGRIFHDPEKTIQRIQLATTTVAKWFNGDTTKLGSDIIRYSAYPETNGDIDWWLDKLLEMNRDLTCDIEGFDLKHYDAGIGTITFCWSEHEGIAFAVDWHKETDPDSDFYGKVVLNQYVRGRLRNFFEKFRAKMIYHNICYDVYVLIYQLFMEDLLDQEGLLVGLEVMLRNWDCTQIISYLATNSCAGNELGLKTQAQEFAGNYAVEDIKDIRKIPLPKLLEYNLVDGLSTWFVYNKNRPRMVKDNQEGVYQQIFRKAVVDIIQMQLTGMPMNMDKVKALDKQLGKESDLLVSRMKSLSLVQSFVDHLGDQALEKKNQKLKTKQVTRADLGSTKDLQIDFNPGSPNQLQALLYSEDFLGLPVLDYTDTRLPATGADTLEKLKNHTKDPEVLRFLDLLIEYKAAAIIISTFLPAFLKAKQGPDGWHYLFGNFRLGGTASGRLSSNGPNLQNIPSSGSTPVKQRLAKLIKECFEAPPGWLFVGLDFDSLEDKISAVTTRDPEKIKVYSDGYDGHCLRALAYFGDQMPDIEIAPDGATTYEAVVNGETIYFHGHETIDYLGEMLTGDQLFEKLNQEEKAA